MSIIIPDEILQAARMTGEELKQEIAILLFQKEKLALEQARKLFIYREKFRKYQAAQRAVKDAAQEIKLPHMA